MDAIDDALIGQGEPPLILRMFLLATGERGIGFKHVFGDRVVSVSEFEVLSYCQRRVLEASTDEGRQDISVAYAARKDAELEANKVAEKITQQKPFDPERMTPEEFQAWMRQNQL